MIPNPLGVIPFTTDEYVRTKNVADIGPDNVTGERLYRQKQHFKEN